jgi:hypothetical protein
MVAKAPRQPASTTRPARGAVPPSAPTTPTVAASADSVPKCDGGNQLAATLSVPMKVTVAPMPTTKRPVMRSASEGASPMARVPRPMRALPPATTLRTPKLSMRSPAGIMKPAYA